MDGRREKQAKRLAVVAVVNPGAGMHADPSRLRGIPVVGGACGTSPGTDPYFAYERKEASRRVAA